MINKYLNSNSCTIFCKLKSCDEVTSFIQGINNQNMNFQFLDKPTIEKVSVCVSFDDNSSLEVYAFKRSKGGDHVSKTIMGTYNFFKNIPTEAYSNKEFIQQHLADCNASIGVKTSSDFSGNKYEYLLMLVKEFDGLIFDGTGMIDQRGGLILDLDGIYSVVYE